MADNRIRPPRRTQANNGALTGDDSGQAARRYRMTGVLAAGLLTLAGPAAADCAVRNFLTEQLLTGDPVEAALMQAYPGLAVSGDALAVGGATVALQPARGLTGTAWLDSATVGDQFTETYPLAWDPTLRERPWADPGRARNAALFAALWGESESQVAAALVTVTYPPTDAAFRVNQGHCLAVQLTAALAAIAAESPAHDRFLTGVGGGFNWRVIAGTDRLSSHSFGTAIDLNPDLGGYWRWSGRPEGDVGPITSQIPERLVAIMEAHGFIWGGKWHHYDGMHFEYRPDLILHARMTGG
jgi:hypothetical protein